MMMYATIKYLAAVEHTSVGLTHACPNNSFHFTGHAAFSQRPRIPPTCPTYLADLMTECWQHDPKVHWQWSVILCWNFSFEIVTIMWPISDAETAQFVRHLGCFAQKYYR